MKRGMLSSYLECGEFSPLWDFWITFAAPLPKSKSGENSPHSESPKAPAPASRCPSRADLIIVVCITAITTLGGNANTTFGDLQQREQQRGWRQLEGVSRPERSPD